MNQFSMNDFPKIFNKNSSPESSKSIQNDIRLTELSTNEYKVKTVTNCKDISEVFQLFDSVMNDEQQNLDEALLLKVQFDQNFEKLSVNELQRLSRKFKNKSKVITLESTNHEKYFIYWKSKEILNFLTLLPYRETPPVTDKDFYDFVASFLAKSLVNEHLGLLSSSIKYAEKTGNVQLHSIADPRGFNLLLLAAEDGHNKIVEILLGQNIETAICSQNQEIRAQDVAWEAQHHEIIVALLKFGVVYPESFNIDNCSSELKKFCENSEELHLAIIQNNESRIVEILDQNPIHHSFYNRLNESAAKIALRCKQINTYKLLTANKVFLGRHEVLNDFFGIFSESDRETLRDIHFENSVHVSEKHLKDLSNKSSVSHDEKYVKENLIQAQYAFEFLNKIEFIQIILLIVAASQKLKKIIFDFMSSSVDVVDPTAGSNTRGMYYTNGVICIAASFLLSQSTEHEAFGTLAHELCHYTMFVVYKNKARPYKQNDKTRRQEFERIVKICKENRKRDELIDLAFNYPQNLVHAELIVRVPHLMAFYHTQPEKLQEVRENFIELFKYYEEKVVSDMKEARPKIESEIERMDEKIIFNKIIIIFTVILSIIAIISGIFITRLIFHKPTYTFDQLPVEDQNLVKNASVYYKNVEIQFQDLFPKNSSIYQTLTSNHIAQVLNNQPLNFSDSHLHYINEQVTHSWLNITQKLKDKILTSNVIFQNEILNFKILNEECRKAFDFLTSKQIIDVLDDKELIIDKMITNDSFYMERYFRDISIFDMYAKKNRPDQSKRDKLVKLIETENAYNDFLKNFTQQNISLYLDNITDIKYSYITDILLPILEDQDAVRYRPKPKFKRFNKNTEEVIKFFADSSRIFILSSEAGTGKTTTFEHLTMRVKKLYPTRWVSFIDLKGHKELYSKSKFSGNVSELLEKIFNLTSSNEFEKKVFEELFRTGKVVLFWNGFDEISPTYSDFILDVFDIIYQKTKNIQYICTRPLFNDVLKKRFSKPIFEFVPLDDRRKSDFLRQVFISTGINEYLIKNYTEKVQKVSDILLKRSLEQENRDINLREDLNTPLMLKMIAELVANDNEIFETENLWHMYERFIEQKIEIWDSKNEYALKFMTSSFTANRNFNMVQMYQMYALKSELPDLEIHEGLIIKNLKIMRMKVPKELTSDKISQMGILYINDNQFKFAHKTFTEFFVAQFFIDNIYYPEYVNPEDAELIIQLFFELSKYYIQRQVVITNFMKYFLDTQNLNNSEKFHDTIADIFRTKFKTMFFNLLQKEQLGTFEFLFNFFKKDHELLVDMLSVNESETLYTAAFNRAYFGSSYGLLNRKGLKDLGRRYLNDNEYERFISERDQRGIIEYSLYIFNREDVNALFWRNRTVFHDVYDLSDKILQNNDQISAFKDILKNLTKNEVTELLVSKTSPITWFGYEIVNNKNLWDIVNSSLTQQEQKIMISNILCRFCMLKNSTQFLINKTEEISSSSEIIKIFNEQKILHLNLYCTNNDNFEDLWKLFVKHSSKDQQKTILHLRIDSEILAAEYREYASPYQKRYGFPPFNLMEITFIYPSKNFKYISELYSNYFNSIELQNIFLKSQDLIAYLLVYNGADVSEDFAIYLRNVFRGNKDSLKKFLFRKIENTSQNVFEFLRGDTALKPLSDLLEYLENGSMNMTDRTYKFL